MVGTSEEVRERIHAGDIEELIKQTHALRIGAFHEMARVFLAVREKHANEAGRIEWSSVTPEKLDQPVTLRDIEAWFKSDPPKAAVQTFATLFDTWRSESPTWAEAIEACARVSPLNIRALLPNSMWLANARTQNMLRGFGEEVGGALGLAAVHNNNASDAELVSYLSPEGVLAYIETCADVFQPYSLGSLMRGLPDARDMPGEFGDIYVDIMIALGDHDSITEERRYQDYRIDQRWLDGPQIARIIAAKPGDLEVARWLMATCAFDGHPQAFDAFGELLEDEHLGEEAMLYLGLGGEWGRAVVERLLEDEATSGVARSRVEILADFEPPRHPHSKRILSPLLGHLVKHHRFGFDFASLLIRADRDAPDETNGEPSSLRRILDAQKGSDPNPEKWQRDLAKVRNETLEPTPQEWFDLLWLKALSPNRTLQESSYENAKNLGLLGRKPTDEAFLDLIEHLDWRDAINNQKHIGFGAALLAAGASEQIYCHAISRYTKIQTTNLVGHLETCFDKPLEDATLPWAKAVRKLLWHLRFQRHNPHHALSEPTSFAQAEGAGSISIDAPGDVFFRCKIGATRPCKITVRGDVTLSIDPKEGSFLFEGLPQKISGDLPPIGTQGYSVEGEIHKNRGIFGVNGVIIEGQQIEDIEVLPAEQTAPISVEVMDPTVTCAIELLEKYSETLGNHVLSLLRDMKDTQALAEIRAMRNPIAAYTLYLFSQLAPLPETRDGAMVQLRELGELAEPYLGEVPEPRGKSPVKAVSFEVLAGRMQALSEEPLFTGDEAGYQQRRWIGFEDVNAYPEPDEDEEYDGWGGGEVDQVCSAILLCEEFGTGKDAKNYWLENEEHRGLLDVFISLSGNGAWYEGKANGQVYFDQERELILADLALEQDSGGGWPTQGATYLACWRCEEGWVFASWGRSRSQLQEVIGLDFWPTQLEWRSVEGWLGY